MTGIILMQNKGSIPDIQKEKFTDTLDETLWPAKYKVTIYNFTYDGTSITQVGDPISFEKVTFTFSDSDMFPEIHAPSIPISGEIQLGDFGTDEEHKASVFSDFLSSYFKMFPENRMWTKVGSSLDARRQAESGAIAIGLITYLYFISISYPAGQSPGLQD